MAHMEPMDVDSISNDFDDKENSLQNSNVLPRTPSTEKGYEELDVSELNMKLRYSMTPATSPMSRSFTANCRDNKVCDNENNSINTMFNDNSNLTHSFNSTITDNILKSSKFPLQVLPTEQFVDDNGNPIIRSLDVECNNVTITVNGPDNIDDNLSLPSTSSSLAHTPEATTPTKEIAKDGGSPIMRGLKSVLNMFRSSQSPIPSDDITTNDLNQFEAQKKEESSNLTYLESTTTTTNKNKENISKTNTPLKESLVFNEDLEKELLWKDETTILFKEEKVPIYKLFFPPNSAALESLNSSEKENINTTVEYMDGSFNETINADNDKSEVVKSFFLESGTVNSPESDSEFVDCETSYTKSDTRILDDNIPILSPIIKNILPESFITDGNTFQPNEIVDTNWAKQTNAIIINTIKEADNDEKQAIHNVLPILRDIPDQINILSNTLKQNIPNDLAEKCNTILHKTVNELVQCSNETFNLEKSETKDLQIDKEYKNDIINKSDIVNNEVFVCDEGKEDFKELYPSQITDEIEDVESREIVCDFDSTIVLNELILKEQADTLKINDIKLPLDSQVVNEVKIDLGVLQDQIITTEKNIENLDNKCNIKLYSETIEDTILNQKQNNERETFIPSDQIIHLETKDIKTVDYNLPSDIPLPCDSDIDKDDLQDIIEENSRDNDKTVNISSNNLNVDLSYSTESIKQTIDGVTRLTEIHSETLPYSGINYIVTNTSIIQTSQLAPSEDMSNAITYVTLNESDDTEIYNTKKCIPKVIGATKDISSNIINSVIFPSNNNNSVSGIDLDVTHHTLNNKNVTSQNHDDFVQTSKSTDVENETVIDVKIKHDEVCLSSTNNKTVTGMELVVSKHELQDIENPFETKNKLSASLEVQRCDSVIGDVSSQYPIESVLRGVDDKNYITNEIDVRVKYDDVDIPITDINSSVSEVDLDVTHQTHNNIHVIKQNYDNFVQTSKYTDVENETVIDVKIKHDEVSLSSTNNKTVTGMELVVSKHELQDIENPFETKNKLSASLEVQRCDSVIGDVSSQYPIESVLRGVDDKNYITNEIDVRVKYDDVDIPITDINSSVSEVDLDVTHQTHNNIHVIKQNYDNFVQTSKYTDVENETVIDVKIKHDEVSLSSTNNKTVTGMELVVSKHELQDIENPFETKNKLSASLEVQRCDSVIGDVSSQYPIESVLRGVDDKNYITNEIDVRVKYDDVDIPITDITSSVTEVNLDVTHQTHNNIHVIKQNYDNFVQTSKSTDVENETVIDVKIKHDEVSLSSTNNETVTGMELDVSIHDLKEIENPFETKNKLTASFEVQRCDSVIGDLFPQNHVQSVPRVAEDTNYITNEMDVRVKYDDADITITNINTSVIGMDLDVPIHDFENIEIPGRNITTKSDVSIKEEVSLPSNFNNSSVMEMELDISKLDLEDVCNVNRKYRNLIDTKTQFKSSPEEQGRESVIENRNATKDFENIFLDDCNLIRNKNDLKINEVISMPTNSNTSVTELELDVSKHDLIASENPIKASFLDRNNEDCEIMNNGFKNIPRQIDERLELTSKSDVTINDEIFFPLTKETSSEINLGVSKYDEKNIKPTFEIKGCIASPQISSKLTQDGCSIDFNEIEDPFITKTNSPTSNNSIDDFLNTKRCNIITDYQKRPEPNRRKTQEDRKNSNVANEGASASFGIVNSCLENVRVKEIEVNDGEKPDFIEKNMNSALSTSDGLHDDIEINTPEKCTFLGQTEKAIEGVEIHLSNKISSSSSKIYESKNVFNLPELNDNNFKPLTTPSNLIYNKKTSSDVYYNPLERTTIESARAEAEKNSVQDLSFHISPNLSNVTCSSKNTDDITSLRDVNTEDEDTVEGPFLEAEDFSDIVKVSDFETGKDMMNFEDLPTRTNDDNDNGEFFIDAEAFEFLLNQNKSNVVADSGKESLFLKFDPLFAKRISSDGVLAALNKIQKRQSTPKKLTPLKIMSEEDPTPGPSTTMPIGLAAPVATDIVEEPVAAMSKPMMVVNPAIASFVSPRKSTTPPKVNRRSLTFTSPAMAVIDRLLSLSGNSPSLDQDSSLPISREYNETDYALTQLRELLADKEIHVNNLRSESKELKERFAILESQVRSLETESEERLRKVKELNYNLAEKNKINKSMAIVVEEYERTIASLIAEMEQEKKQNAKERMRLISERDEQTAHLASMEVSFSDLHSKYEKSKQIILSMKANEDTYKKSLNEFEVNLLKMQTNYDLLKQHATSKLNHANQELEKYNRAHDAEVVKLNAMIKRKELHITSLEESLSQKTKANEELTAICDELINKVG